jgi:LysM repeat protein
MHGKKLIGLTLLAGASALVAACGTTGSGAQTQTTITVPATSFATLATTPPTQAPTTLAPGVVAGEQTYTVVGGDYGFLIVEKCGIPLADLAVYNAWPETDPTTHAFNVGDEIRIPNGGIAGCTGAPSAATNPPTAATGTTIAGGQSNCGEGTHVIAAGDLPGTVAADYGTTVAALEAANVNTQGYKNFIVGVTIKIPAKENC